MTPTIVLVLCAVFVVGLLVVERKRNPEASLALWVPTAWMLIAGSRSVGSWFTDPSSVDLELVDEMGSPVDRWVLGMLILIAVWIIFYRKLDWKEALRDNQVLVLAYLFLGVSILWSDFFYLSFKRWARLSAVIVMGLLILSERKPADALESVLRRCAYVLLPFSIVLIKYFPEIGRQYGRWDGQLMWVGVGTQKNGLGLLCAISLFLLLWSLIRDWSTPEKEKSKVLLMADGVITALALYLLRGPGGSYSAAAVAVFLVGSALSFLLYLKPELGMAVSVRLKTAVFGLMLVFVVGFEALIPSVASVFGRNETLTGRLDIWRSVLDAAWANPLLGSGYGCFWSREREISFIHGVNQAHNGYLDVFADTGAAGLVALFLVVMSFCNKIRREHEDSSNWGIFGICLIFMLLLYNVVESSFFNGGLLWSLAVLLMFVYSKRFIETEPEAEDAQDASLSFQPPSS